ncbi:MAG: flagellar protein FlaG [Desulfatiglans sp.]|jgi:flagellar protein FlaG|nr:flagellar protein FlaG [Desulfatiglans sp.]
MEAVQNITRALSKRQIDTITPVSSSANIKNRALSAENNSKKEPQDIKLYIDSLSDKISRIAETMDSYVQSIQRDLKIKVDENTGKIIVKVISRENGKVIREIPPDELLDLAARIEEMTGILFDEKV